MDENFVLGVEADFSTGISSSERIRYSPPTQGVNWESEWNWLATLRGRAGLSVNKTMLYVTGGLAIADASYAMREFPVDDVAIFDGTVTGLVAGVGVEHALSDSMRLKLEYMTYGMEKKDACRADAVSGNCDITAPQNDEHVHWVTSANTFRVGVNWNF